MSDSPTPDVSLREKAPEYWVVWSFQHRAWWCSGHSGYSQSFLQAGLYTEAEAKAIEAGANRGSTQRYEEARPLSLALSHEAALLGRPAGSSVVHLFAAALSRVERAEADSTAAYLRGIVDGTPVVPEVQLVALAGAAKRAHEEIPGADVLRAFCGCGYHHSGSNRPLCKLLRTLKEHAQRIPTPEATNAL